MSFLDLLPYLKPLQSPCSLSSLSPDHAALPWASGCWAGAACWGAKAHQEICTPGSLPLPQACLPVQRCLALECPCRTQQETCTPSRMTITLVGHPMGATESDALPAESEQVTKSRRRRGACQYSALEGLVYIREAPELFEILAAGTESWGFWRAQL